ncbi:MAG: hypothetical protein SVR04_10040 [Spirochaetota bacterium]|nr:hypothetical protein [Spirochaetota bacterium]
MARDEISYLLERMERQEIDVQKPYTESIRQNPVQSENVRLIGLIHDAMKLLRGGDWIRKYKIQKLCEEYNISFDHFGEMLDLAVSDDGRWVSWPSDSTPEVEPRKTH